MIDNLPEPYREAIVLTELEGLTQQQLAERAGLSLSGAKSRVQRGRAMLKAELEACCRFEFDQRGRVMDCEPRRRQPCPECG
jgi:RNA polymerase sigma-70 factor (ECF subfamily)